MFYIDSFLQFERRGYYRVDKVNKKGEDFEYDMIFIPDGKAVGLASIAKQTDKQGDIAKQSLADKVAEKKNKEAKGKNKKKGEAKVEGEAAPQEGEKKEDKPIAEEKKEEAPKTEDPPKPQEEEKA